jgi:hypothetical protein
VGTHRTPRNHAFLISRLWRFHPRRSKPYRYPAEPEALTLEGVQLALELDVDVNATDLKGRTVDMRERSPPRWNLLPRKPPAEGFDIIHFVMGP